MLHLRPEEETIDQENPWPLWIYLIGFPFLKENEKTHVLRIFFTQNDYPKSKFALDILRELLKDPIFFYDISSKGQCNKERAQKLGKERISCLAKEAMQDPIKKGLPFLNDLRHFFTLLFCLNFFDLDFKTLGNDIKEERDNIRNNFFKQAPHEQLWMLSISPLVSQEAKYFSAINEMLPDEFDIQSEITTFLNTQKIVLL